MLLEPDIQKLAVESRQRLVEEFAEKYANLRERVKRVPDGDAQKISEKLSCPLEVAMIAYLINMDGIMTVKKSVGHLSTELERRATVGEDVPNLSGNIMEFALVEGRWISHIYGSFVRQLELKARELANLEEGIDETAIEVEKALSIIATRTKISETFIEPILNEWMKEHPKANSLDVLSSFGESITKWNRSTLTGKFIQVQRRNQALFRCLRESLVQTSESFTMDASINRLDTLLEELESPFDEMTLRGISHLLLHIVPRISTGRGDRSSFVAIGVGSTRGNKAEPDLTSPIDFLERDVKLAKRRRGIEREEYLKEKISRVLRVLKYQKNTPIDSLEKCLTELNDRLNLEAVPLEDEIVSSTEILMNTPETDRDSKTMLLIYSFVSKYAYGEESA
ncbi:MAG: hypothetical protein ACXABH_11390 [Candidatus Thorarchaeota archaeon]